MAYLISTSDYIYILYVFLYEHSYKYITEINVPSTAVYPWFYFLPFLFLMLKYCVYVTLVMDRLLYNYAHWWSYQSNKSSIWSCCFQLIKEKSLLGAPKLNLIPYKTLDDPQAPNLEAYGSFMHHAGMVVLCVTKQKFQNKFQPWKELYQWCKDRQEEGGCGYVTGAFGENGDGNTENNCNGPGRNGMQWCHLIPQPFGQPRSLLDKGRKTELERKSPKIKTLERLNSYNKQDLSF